MAAARWRGGSCRGVAAAGGGYGGRVSTAKAPLGRPWGGMHSERHIGEQSRACGHPRPDSVSCGWPRPERCVMMARPPSRDNGAHERTCVVAVARGALRGVVTGRPGGRRRPCPPAQTVPAGPDAGRPPSLPPSVPGGGVSPAGIARRPRRAWPRSGVCVGRMRARRRLSACDANAGRQRATSSDLVGLRGLGCQCWPGVRPSCPESESRAMGVGCLHMDS